MRFIIISIILHISIFIFVFSFTINKTYKIDKVGNNSNTPNITVNFTSSHSAPTPQKPQEEKNEPKPEEVPEKKEIIKKKKEKEKILKVEKPKKKKAKKIKKIKKIEKKKIIKPIQKTEKSDVTTKEVKTNQSTAPSNSNSNLIQLSQGVFAAKNQGVDGLVYKFISQPDPEYPIVAKRLNFNREVSVKVRFLVGFHGEIEEVKFFTEKDRLGFQKEVEKILKKWRLTPVTLKGVPIKLYFYKEFKFNQI